MNYNKGCTLIMSIDILSKLTDVDNELELLNKLFEYEADLNFPGKDGETSLIKAISNKNLQIIEFLLKKGVKTNLVSNKKDTPLIRAVELKNVKILDLLLEYKADVNFPNDNGDTALIKALELESFHLVQYLINKGANVNCGDNIKSERRPLSIAAKKYDLNTFDYLINCGADINLVKRNIEDIARWNDDFAAYLIKLREQDTKGMGIIKKILNFILLFMLVCRYRPEKSLI